MATSKITSAIRRQQADDSLSMMDMLMICLRHWPWFILSIFVCLGGATLYLLSTPKVYTRTTSILVKSSGDKSNDIKLIEDLGVNNISSNISDEIAAIHSPAVVFDLVKRLHLDFSYFQPGFFRNDPLYAETLPVEVELPDLDDNTTTGFLLTLNGDSTATITDINFQGETYEEIFSIRINKEYQLPFGKIIVKPTLYYNEGTQGDIIVQRMGYYAAASHYGSLIEASLQPGTRNIIDITCNDNSIPRAENILKTIVSIYNENWVKNRNQVSISTNEFIKERLAVIEEELGGVESSIAAYKSSNAMLSVEQVASQAIGQESASDQQHQTIANQLYMIRYVRNYVADPTHIKQLLPASTGIGSTAVENQIAEYNRYILQRNNLVSNSSEQNPLVGDLDITLGNLRNAILTSLDNTEATLNAQLNTVRAANARALSKLSAAPQQQNHLLSFERQQKVKESLYLFLLQKREENELSQAFTAYNTRIIAAPWGSSQPTAPEQNRILLMAFALALAIPASFFIVRENLNSKVRGRKDLENLTIPYVGELPLWGEKKSKKEKKEKEYQFVVQHHKRDIVNEAFRVVRTNLEFMTNMEKESKIIMLTSFNPGSGKTFICGNLATSFCIRGSKVICIDLDLRRGSLSQFVDSPKQGLTNYLSGQVNDYKSLIVHHKFEEGTEDDKSSKASTLDFLPMGKMPPNPTELLYSQNLKVMLQELRQQYDYIFIDCPPVEIVADATIINKEADVVLFIIRAGLMERDMLPELQKNYEAKKYKNMALLLNGTDAQHHYGYHRYGYGYGHYGYGGAGKDYYGSKKS